MTVQGLNHYTVIGYDLAAAKQFYSDIIGLTLISQRDQGITSYIDFSLPGSKQPIVSVVDTNVKIAPNTRDTGFQLHGEASLEGKKAFATGAFEHICFTFPTTDFESIKEKLLAHRYQCREGYDFMPNCKQIWTIDPNGVKVECLFTN